MFKKLNLKQILFKTKKRVVLSILSIMVLFALIAGGIALVIPNSPIQAKAIDLNAVTSGCSTYNDNRGKLVSVKVVGDSNYSSRDIFQVEVSGWAVDKGNRGRQVDVSAIILDANSGERIDVRNVRADRFSEDAARTSCGPDHGFVSYFNLPRGKYYATAYTDNNHKLGGTKEIYIGSQSGYNNVAVTNTNRTVDCNSCNNNCNNCNSCSNNCNGCNNFSCNTCINCGNNSCNTNNCGNSGDIQDDSSIIIDGSCTNNTSCIPDSDTVDIDSSSYSNRNSVNIQACLDELSAYNGNRRLVLDYQNGNKNDIKLVNINGQRNECLADLIQSDAARVRVLAGSTEHLRDLKNNKTMTCVAINSKTNISKLSSNKSTNCNWTLDVSNLLRRNGYNVN